MNPGRELDAEIARRVFGLVQSETQPHLWRDKSRFENPAMPLPNYSTYISDAWTVFEKFKNEGKAFGIYWGTDISNVEIWCVSNSADSENGFWFSGWNEGSVYINESAITAPLAICLAALKAVESK